MTKLSFISIDGQILYTKSFESSKEDLMDAIQQVIRNDSYLVSENESYSIMIPANILKSHILKLEEVNYV